MSVLKVIILKELKRVFSDRRLVFTVFILPGVSLFLIYSVIGSFIGDLENTLDEHTPIVYIQNAPDNFVSFMDDSGYQDNAKITYLEASENLEEHKEAILSEDIDLIVVFDENFMEKILYYDQFDSLSSVNTYYNSNANYSNYARNIFVNKILDEYETYLLTMRFGDINYINAFTIDAQNEKHDLANEQQKAGKSLSFLLPMLISIFLFAGAMGVGPDMIAGEKERGTIATLLLTPMDRHQLALGKIISLGIISLLSTASLFIGIVASLPYSGSFLGTGDVQLSALQLRPLHYIELILILLSQAIINVSIICYISSMAKTIKEANTYLSPCYMIVVFLAIISSMGLSTPETWKFFIPIYGNIISLQQFLTFNLTGLQLVLSVASSLLTSGILIYLITRKFNSEKIILS